ncbi:MAG: hypothetical protein HY762_08925 [Planctomycetes bacterium]|nr:hypothetical protein [Planctomycetota bacterium]
MAAERHFGNWTKAVQNLGIDYPMCFSHRWSGKKVIQKLRERYRRHLPLHYTSLYKTRDGRRLYAESVYYFGNLRNAIKASNINPETAIGPPRQYWSPEKILAALKKRARQGRSLLRLVIKQEDSRLFSATCRYFRKWNMALKKAGFCFNTLG